ncbi:hypothetical protein F5X96DRAFT_145388 [Biscogniauxia mediterranea]|nr:hypothetical protein F5X96DRAFT_145388 [Biscogniauxia mediterranea]
MLSPPAERIPLPTEGPEHMSTSDTMDNENPECSPKKDDSLRTESDHSMVDAGNDDSTTDQIVYEATIYEIDENNIIRSLHTDKAGEVRTGVKGIPAILPPDPEKPAFNQGTTWQPIIQRSQRDIALCIDKYKRPLVIHDLVDENNTGIMVIHGDQAIIQGHHEEVRSTIEALFESQEEDSEASLFVSIRDVYGESAARERQAGRCYSLVDINRRYKLMDRKQADRLMDKNWLDPIFKGLVVAELRPADPSPIGALKEGRRLVPIEAEEDSTGLRQAQFGRAKKGDTESAEETQATGYQDVLASKTWFG